MSDWIVFFVEVSRSESGISKEYYVAKDIQDIVRYFSSQKGCDILAISKLGPATILKSRVKKRDVPEVK